MSAQTLAAERRDKATVRTAAGVRLNPEHWASISVHAHRTWTGQHEILVWCGITANLEDGARQTTDLISCLACAQASFQVAIAR